MISDLVCICVDYFERNLTDKNAMEVMTAAFMTNQKELFESACKFVFKNNSQIVASDILNAWKELEERDPMLALKMLKEAAFKINDQIASHIVASEAWKVLEEKDAMLALKMLKEAVFNCKK